MKKILFFGMLLFAAMTASAQYVHIVMDDGTKYDLDTKSITTMKMDTEAPSAPALKPGEKVQGTVTIGSKTYTKAVGGTIGNAVDLGLPSGTLWADHNVGATNPEDYGAYIMWSEVGAKEQGYENGIKYYYCSDTAEYSIYTGSVNRWRKYVVDSEDSYNGFYDYKRTLEAMDDAATVNWGDDWMTPTFTQIEELTESTYTIWTWTTRNGVNGYEIKSKQNENSIFLPASGIVYYNRFDGINSRGIYMSSKIPSGWVNTRNGLQFNSTKYAADTRFGRDSGISLRPVLSKK